MAVDLAIISLVALGSDVAAQLVPVLLPKFLWLTSAIPVVITGVTAILPLLYFFMTVAVTGQTVGKGMMGLRVVRTDGRRPGVGRTLVRTVAYVVSIVPLFAGFLWVLVDKDRRGWHDHIAGTRVVFDHPRAVDR